jgi:hypothetical protein
MSKVDAQRAMREAKYARIQENSAALRQQAVTAPRVPAAPAPRVTSAPRPQPTETAVAQEETPFEERSQDVCGHRSMNGRTCTRESGHSQKSHRYS